MNNFQLPYFTKNKYPRITNIMHQISKKMHASLFLHHKSQHTFSIHRYIALLVLRQYESKSYKGFVEWMHVSTQITLQLHLKTTPHFTALQKAAARISDAALHVAIGQFIGIASPGSILEGINATGFEDGHAAPYYAYRCNLIHAFTKCSTGSYMESQLACAVVVWRHPVSHDTRHFPKRS